MKKALTSVFSAGLLLLSFCAAQASEWSVTRSAGQQSVQFSPELSVYRTEYRWEPRHEYVCVMWNPRGGCLAWGYRTYYEPVSYEVFDHAQRSQVSVNFPADAVLVGGQAETVTLEYFHNAGFFDRYDAFKVYVRSDYYKYAIPTHRFDNWSIPPAHAFALAKGQGNPPPPDPDKPSVDPELVQFVKQNLTFTIANRSGKGALDLQLNPSVMASRTLDGFDYEVVKYFPGSTISFPLVKGKRELKDFAGNTLSLPLYQELLPTNIYQIRLKVHHNFKKAVYEWSAPIAIGLVLSNGTFQVEEFSSPLLRIKKILPASVAPF